MDRRRHPAEQRLLAALVCMLLLWVALPATILAATEPNGHASCVGLEQASISPPGTSDEEPGGAHQFVGEVKGIAATLGLPPGAVMAFIASLHAGSHADCDEALEE